MLTRIHRNRPLRALQSSCVQRRIHKTPVRTDRGRNAKDLLHACWPQVTRQGKSNGLGARGHLLDVAVAALVEEFEDLAHEQLRHGGATGNAHGGHAVEPLLLDLLGEVHEVGILGASFERDLNEAHGVRRVLGAHHDHKVALRRDGLDGTLAVLRGVANIV